MKEVEKCSKEHIADFVNSLSPRDLQLEVSQMTSEQMSIAVGALQSSKDKEWREKLSAVFFGLSERSLLEAVGKGLNAVQTLALLDIAKEGNPKDQWKLSSLFVGIPHIVFMNLLAACDDDQYHTLQLEALTEPVQHHLTVLVHDLIKQNEIHHKTMSEISEEIILLDPATTTSSKIYSLLDRIEILQEIYHKLLEINNRALGLAWNTDRPDLVDGLNTTKDTFIKVYTKEIGTPRIDLKPATGIYALFEQHLNTIYGNVDDSSDIEALHDDEPALEAMTKFSIWYLQDYWELGLLPSIKSEKQLRLDRKQYSESECIEYRENLLSEIKKGLEKMGISTVADFKRAQIYSKKILQEYISNHSK